MPDDDFEPDWLGVDGFVPVGVDGADPEFPLESPCEFVGVDEGGGLAGFVRRGGSSPEPDFESGAAPAGAGELFAGAGFLVRRGGASIVSIPTGVDSALGDVLFFSVPAGTHDPVAIQGVGEFTALLCSAALTVNRPWELPVCSTS